MFASDSRLSDRDSLRVRRSLCAARAGACFLLFGVIGCGGEQAQKLSDTVVVKAPIVVVFNGCGVPGSARKIAEVLRAAGFDVGNGHGENADSFEYPATLVVDYMGRPAEAQKVAGFLGAPMIQQISHDPDRFGTIGVIVGADFSVRLAAMTGK